MSAISAVLDPCALIPPIARALAARYHRPVGDLTQAGRIAVLAVVADPTQSETSQRAYLRLRIRGAMLDPIRRELQRREVSRETEPAARQVARTMGELLLLLPPRSRAMLELRIAGFSQAETGAQLGVSQSRVSRLEKRAVDTLRKKVA